VVRYLVEVRPGSEEQVKSALRALGVSIVKQVLNYISVDMPPRLVPRVEAIPGVVRVVEERTYRVQAFTALAPPKLPPETPVEAKLSLFMRLGGPANPLALAWSYAQGFNKDRWPTSESRRVLGADVADSMNISGRGVKVAVLDTGFDWSPQLLTVDHMESVLKGDPLPLDQNGHGTWCITAIKGSRSRSPWGVNEGVAKGVAMASIKTLGYGIGTASTSDVMEAIVRAAEWGAKVVSMSLGGDVKPGEHHDPDQCPLCSLITRLARERGMLFAVAAGNSGEGYASCPGLSPGTITVAALNKDLTVAYFSSRGHPEYLSLGKPEVAAPGVNTGASSTGLIASMEWYDGFKTAFISGTCLTGDINVYTPDGPVKLKDLKVGDTIYSYSPDGRTTVGKVVNIIDQGTKEVYELVTADGRRLYATGNHPILVVDGGSKPPRWKRVDEIKPGRHAVVLASPEPVPVQELNELITVEMARALGYFLADGWISHTNRKHQNWMVNTAHDDEWFFKTFGIPFKPYDKTSIVKKIEKAGEDKVYDITVEPYPHFVAEGIVVHNSMATPHIAGLLALWAEYARRKGVELNRDIVIDIVRHYSPGWRSDVGYGPPRFEWIVDYLR